MKRLARSAPAALALAAACLTACKSAPPLQRTGPDLRAPAATLEWKVAAPLEVGERTYAITSGEHAGKELNVTTARSADRWTATYTLAGATDPLRIDTLQERSDALVLLETITPSENAISRYDPPLTVLPARLAPGEPHEQTVMLSVHPVSDPSRTTQQGPAKQTLTLEGAERITTPAGDFDAHVVRAKLDINLPGATVNRESFSWYAPGDGLVADEFREEIRILGLFPRTTTMRIEAHDGR